MTINRRSEVFRFAHHITSGMRSLIALLLGMTRRCDVILNAAKDRIKAISQTSLTVTSGGALSVAKAQ